MKQVTLSQNKCAKTETVSALADTGAEVSIISNDIVKRNGFRINQSHKCSLAMADRSTGMSCLGSTYLKVKVEDKVRSVICHGCY